MSTLCHLTFEICTFLTKYIINTDPLCHLYESQFMCIIGYMRQPSPKLKVGAVVCKPVENVITSKGICNDGQGGSRRGSIEPVGEKKEVSYKKYYVFSLYVLVRFLWSFPFSSTWAQTGIRAKFQFQGEY